MPIKNTGSTDFTVWRIAYWWIKLSMGDRSAALGFIQDSRELMLNPCNPFPKSVVCLSAALHNPDLVFRQPVELVHQGVDLGVRGLDLALQHGLFVGRVGCGQLLVEGEHA